MADKYVKLDDVIDTLEQEWGYEGMREDLYDLPTEDVVKVVRCKDCTEWDKNECECSHWYGFRENDFCSYGERKDT